MAKKANYRAALAAVLDAQERRPHVYGRDDCLMRCGEAVAAILDDPAGVVAAMEKYRGRYKTLAGAYRALSADGFESPLEFVASFFPEIHISRAVDGDVGAYDEGGHWAFGVICGAHFYVSAADGTGILPRSRAERCFKVE